MSLTLKSSVGKVLEFSDMDPVKAYAHHTIPLSIILLDDRNVSWLHEHFNQIFCYVNDDILQVDYIEQLRQYREILDIVQIPVYKASAVTDLVSFLVNSINSNLYVTIYVDEFYLENRYATNTLHYMRQIVINGYDTDAKLFHCKGFTRYNDNSFKDSGYDQYGAETIPFDTLVRAYNEGYSRYNDPPDKYIIIWGSKKDASGYEFKIRDFISRLNQYITSSGQMFQQTGIGQNVLKVLEETIYWMIHERRATLDSRALYTVFEHKKRLHESLTFVRDFFDPPSETFDRLLTEYATTVVTRAQKLFYQYLHFEYKARVKGLIIDKVFSPYADDTRERRTVVRNLENIISNIQELKAIDMTVTTNLCHELMHHFG